MWLCAPVRAAAAEALGSMRDDRARGALLQALFDVDRVVYTCAARSLGSVPDRAAIKALLRVLRDEDPTVRVAASEGLALLDAMPWTDYWKHCETRTGTRAAAAVAQGEIGAGEAG